MVRGAVQKDAQAEVMAIPSAQLEKREPAGLLAAGPSALWSRAQLAWQAMQPGQRGWTLAAGGMVAVLVAAVFWLKPGRPMPVE